MAMMVECLDHHIDLTQEVVAVVQGTQGDVETVRQRKKKTMEEVATQCLGGKSQAPQLLSVSERPVKAQGSRLESVPPFSNSGANLDMENQAPQLLSVSERPVEASEPCLESVPPLSNSGASLNEEQSQSSAWATSRRWLIGFTATISLIGVLLLLSILGKIEDQQSQITIMQNVTQFQTCAASVGSSITGQAPSPMNDSRARETTVSRFSYIMSTMWWRTEAPTTWDSTYPDFTATKGQACTKAASLQEENEHLWAYIDANRTVRDFTELWRAVNIGGMSAVTVAVIMWLLWIIAHKVIKYSREACMNGTMFVLRMPILGSVLAASCWLITLGVTKGPTALRRKSKKVVMWWWRHPVASAVGLVVGSALWTLSSPTTPSFIGMEPSLDSLTCRIAVLSLALHDLIKTKTPWKALLSVSFLVMVEAVGSGVRGQMQVATMMAGACIHGMEVRTRNLDQPFAPEAVAFMAKRKSAACTVDLYLDDEQCWREVLLDTGAARCMMPKSWLRRTVQKFGVQKLWGLVLRSASGENMLQDPAYTKMRFRFKREGKLHTCNALIGSEQSIPILGTDFWSKGAVVDFNRMEVTLGKEKIPFKASQSSCAAVREWHSGCGTTLARATCDFVLQPGEQYRMNAMVDNAAPELNEAHLLIAKPVATGYEPSVPALRNPTEDADYTADAWTFTRAQPVSEVGGNRVRMYTDVRVENTSTEPRVIRKGMPIATLQLFDMDQDGADVRPVSHFTVDTEEVIAAAVVREELSVPQATDKLAAHRSSLDEGKSAEEILLTIMHTLRGLPHQEAAQGELIQVAAASVVDKLTRRLPFVFDRPKSLSKAEAKRIYGLQKTKDRVCQEQDNARKSQFKNEEQALEAERQETEKMLKLGIVEPSRSEWSANVVMVKKKANLDGTPGGWRYCVNYAATRE